MITNIGKRNKLKISGIDNSQALMLKAQENALNAKEEVRKTLEQIYENNRYLNTLDDTLERLFGETEQSISQNADELLKKNSLDILQEYHEDKISPTDYPDALPIDIYPEIRRKFTYEEPEEAIRKELEDYIEETRKIREDAEAAVYQAQKEAEAAQSHARVAIAIAQDKVKESAELVKQAREETRLAKERAENSIKKVNEQIIRARNLINDSIPGEIPDGCPVQVKSVDSTPSCINLPHNTFKELYDPLHSISGFTRMMLDDNIVDRAAQKEFLQIILQQSELLKERLDLLSR